MPESYHVWRREDLARLFLEEIRGGIPLAAEQIDVLLRVVRHATPTAERVLDLGCGDGILGRAVLEAFPQTSVVFLDFSETMIAAAQQRIDGDRAAFVTADYGQPGWTERLPRQQFDVVLSGFSIHHQTDQRKREIYGEIFSLLSSGGLFLNLEHVASHSPWAAQAHWDLFHESLWANHRRLGGGKSRQQFLADYEARPSRGADIVAPVEQQCHWLTEIGYVDVDCFFKIFELALFGGRKP
jgi:ubiquinone/menaquinone biosynthesis C-methylase UbiE